MVRIIAVIVASLGVAGGLVGAGFVWSFRTKFRPVQDVIRRVNRSVTNPKQLRTAGQPGSYASVVRHRGRSSGAAYRTPVVVVPTGDGFVIALPYGAGVDWVRNVQASGAATIEHEGATYDVGHPELVGLDEANPWFPAKEQRMHHRFGVTDFLRLRPIDVS